MKAPVVRAVPSIYCSTLVPFRPLTAALSSTTSSAISIFRHKAKSVSTSSKPRLVSPSNFSMPPSHQHEDGKSNILVFGGGNFGSCLADHLGDSSHSVYMWSRSKDLVEHFNEFHRNPQFLRDHTFSDNVKAVGPEFPPESLIKDMDVLLFAIPTEGVRYALLYIY